MSFTASKAPGSPLVTNRTSNTESCGTVNSFAKSIQHKGLRYGRRLASNLRLSCEGFRRAFGKPSSYSVNREHSVQCQSTGTHNKEAKECVRRSSDCPDVSRSPIGDGKVEDLYESFLPEHPGMPEHGSTYSSRGLAEVCRFVCNDAKFVNERARNDIVLLSRGIMKLNDRACQDFAILGLEFLKLDARAREDTEKIDHGVKRKAEHLHSIAVTLRDKAQSKLKSVADKHWNDGALEADLRRADFLAKRRAMEDAFMALEFVKNIHDMMVSKMYKLKQGPLSSSDIILEKNGRIVDFLQGEVSTDRITAIQEAYWSMASALSEADGIDYTDPEELELLVATLIDLDAMDGKSSVSLLAECSNSPDVGTRQALANALASAPSMWTLGNAGMGALQRLAEDSNPAIAAAASRAINELKKQWEIEEGDSWRFTMNQAQFEETYGSKEEKEDDEKMQ